MLRSRFLCAMVDSGLPLIDYYAIKISNYQSNAGKYVGIVCETHW